MEKPRENLKPMPALIALFAVVALEIALRPLLPVDATLRMAATGALRAAEATGLLFWLSRLPSGLTAIGLGRGSYARGFRAGLIWSAVFASVAIAAAAIIYFGFNTDPRSLIHAKVPKGLAAGGIFLMVACLVSPIAEEVFFRGVLYSALRKWGAVAAIIGSTILFTAAHTGAGFPINQIVGGLVFACAIEKSRSLAAPMVIHILGNFAIYGISVING